MKPSEPQRKQMIVKPALPPWPTQSKLLMVAAATLKEARGGGMKGGAAKRSAHRPAPFHGKPLPGERALEPPCKGNRSHPFCADPQGPVLEIERRAAEGSDRPRSAVISIEKAVRRRSIRAPWGSGESS